MSNREVANQMRAVLNDTRAGELSPDNAANMLRGLSSTLEGVPRPLAKELVALCEDLEVASWHDDEGVLSDSDEVLSRLEACIVRMNVHF